MIIFTNVNRNNIIMRNLFVDYLKIIHLVNKIKNYILDKYDYYDYFEYRKFKNYFIEYWYDNNKLLNIEYFNYSGKRHREDGPAYIQYYKNGERHRED